MVRRVPEVPDVHEPDEDTNDSDDLRKHVAKVVQLALERSLLADLGGNGLVDIADGSTLSGEDNDRVRTAVNDAGTLKTTV